MTREEKLAQAQMLWVEAQCGLVCPFPRLNVLDLPEEERVHLWRKYKAYWENRLEKINKFNELMTELMHDAKELSNDR